MYPYQRNRAPYAPIYYQSMPPQVKVDPARLPAAYESWPWDGSYGYPYPVQCHGCCNHSYSPGNFMLRPPYPCVPPPQCHGYASMPGTYPVQYLPPPHYSMEIPCYEYNKDTPREHHCCECRNHLYSQKEGKGIKIEEEEPGHVEMEGNQSMVPYEFKNCPYPIVWLPPGYLKAKEKRSPDDSEYSRQDRSPRGAKYSKSFEDQHSGLNGWFPFDANNRRLLKQGEDETRSQHNQDAKNSKPSGEQPIAWNWWFPFDAKNLGSLKQGDDQKSSLHNQDAKTNENSKSFEEQPRSWNGWFPVDVNKLRSLKPGEDHKRSLHQDTNAYENPKSFEGPSSWNGWFPVDVNKLRSLKPGEDHKRSQHGQHDKQNSFSLPMLWMPDELEATEEEEPKDTYIKQGLASHMEATPVKHHDTEAGLQVNIKDDSQKLADKNTVHKTIPVKQVEQNVERSTSTDSKEKIGGKKSDEDSAKRPSSSTKKSSKLPPVCLRVDPLPKKKGVNGHSRSPSPPGNKGKSHDSSDKQFGSTMSFTLKENANALAADNNTSRSKEVEQKNSKLKATEVCDGTTTEKCGKSESAGSNSLGPAESIIQMKKISEEGDVVKSGSDVEEKRSEEYLESEKETAEVQSSDARCQVDESNPEAKESFGNEVKRSGRMMLSEAEAAVLIQSALRGFEVRKGEPLQKLKQLAKIKEQMGEIKNRIKALESSPDTTCKDKQRTIITEMIMDLLLKLDSIQGVHPSIRDIRKSMAKELVSLQETLDLLIWKNSNGCLEQLSAISSEKNMSKEVEEDLGTSGETTQGDKTAVDCSLLIDKNQPRQEIGAFSKDVEISNPVMAHGNLDGEITKLSEIGSENGSRQAVTGENSNNSNDSLAEHVPHDGEVGHTSEPQQVGGEATSTRKVIDFALADKGGDAGELSETRQLTHDDCIDHPESSQLTVDRHIDTEASSKQEKIEPMVNEVSLDRVTEDEFSENGGVKGLNNAELLQVEGQKLPVMSNPEDAGEVQEILKTEEPGELSPELHETPVNEEGIPDTEILGVLPELHDIPINEQEIPDTTTLREVLPELHEREQEILNTEVEVVPELHEILVHEQEFPDTELCEKMLPELHEHEQEIPNAEVLVEALPELHEIPVDVKGEENGYSDVHEEFPEAKTEIGEDKAAEAFKGACTGAKECSIPRNEAEISNLGQPAKISELKEPAAAEVLGERSNLNNKMQDVSINHIITNTDSLLKEEVRLAACEAPVDLSREHDVGDEHNYLEELGPQVIGPLPGDVEVIDDHNVAETYRLNEAVPAGTMIPKEGNVESIAQPPDSATGGHEGNEMESVKRSATEKGDEGDFISPPSPTASQVSHVSDALTERDEKLIEENEKLREMMEKLIEAGNKQLSTISSLSGRINDLERRLSRRKKLKIKRPRTAASGSSCLKTKSSLEEKALGLAM